MSGNDKGSWLDDPEWKELEQRVNGQSVQKPTKIEVKARQRQLQLEHDRRERAARQKLEAEARTSGTAPTEPKKIDVSLNLTLPNLRLGNVKKKVHTGLSRAVPTPVKMQIKRRSKKQLLIGGAGLAVVVIAVIGMLAMVNGSSKGKFSDKGVLGEKSVKIDFKPLLPNGKTDETTAYKTAVDGQNRPIYTFTDKIGATDLTVTEQPLPESLKGDTDTKLATMAKDLYLTDVINASNPKAYMGTSVRGPQTVIFTKNGLLVFIQSQAKIDKDQWSEYVTRLTQ